MGDIPNVITHGLMALDVYNKLEVSSVQRAIDKHPRAYLLGSNGPDILFYYKALPWQDGALNKEVQHYGNRVHVEAINEFYEVAIQTICDMNDQENKEILIAYVAGHLQHWALDSLAHPFVFYRGGEIAGSTKFWHFRYESMIDSLMVTYVKRRKLQEIKAEKFVDVSREERRVIASFYNMLLYRVFGIETKPEVIDEAIRTFKKALFFLYDPKNHMTPLIQMVENKFFEPWELTSHIVNSKFDTEHDILNLKHEVWSNPTNIDETSTQSFVDLYDDSIKLGQALIDELENVLLGGEYRFNEILNNCQYDTGRPVGQEMKYYNCIYKNNI